MSRINTAAKAYPLVRVCEKLERKKLWTSVGAVNIPVCASVYLFEREIKRAV